MSGCNFEEILYSLPCHFTWQHLDIGSVGRTLEMNIDNLQEHIQKTIQGTELQSYNLMGFYKTQQKCFQEAREYFIKALEYTVTDDERIVSLACLVWLTWKEQKSECCLHEKIEEVKRIINERENEAISEVLTEKAFSIANSGFTLGGFKEGYRCITKALSLRSGRMRMKFIKAIIMKDLYKDLIISCSPVESPEVLEMQQNWKEIIEASKNDTEYSETIYVKSLIEYAEFLHKRSWDYDESGRKLAERAERVADKSNPVIMRSLAEFYILSAKHNTKILEKAENILDKILKEKPSCSRTLHLRGLLFFDKYRFAAKENKENYFNEAKACIYKSWHANGKKDIVPALDLVHICQQKYEDTSDHQIIMDVEVFFREIFQDGDKLHCSSKALLHKCYGAFLKTHGKVLILSHLKLSFQYDPANETQMPRHPLWDLIRELSLSTDFKDQKEAAELHEWMNEKLSSID